MTMSDEAVEAAAKAAYNLTNKTQWWQLSTGYKRELLPAARAALEAAAPHMDREGLHPDSTSGKLRPMAECEAERRIKQTVFLIEQSFGSGRIDLAEIKDTLTGRNTVQCEGTERVELDHG